MRWTDCSDAVGRTNAIILMRLQEQYSKALWLCCVNSWMRSGMSFRHNILKGGNIQACLLVTLLENSSNVPEGAFEIHQYYQDNLDSSQIEIIISSDHGTLFSVYFSLGSRPVFHLTPLDGSRIIIHLSFFHYISRRCFRRILGMRWSDSSNLWITRLGYSMATVIQMIWLFQLDHIARMPEDYGVRTYCAGTQRGAFWVVLEVWERCKPHWMPSTLRWKRRHQKIAEGRTLIRSYFELRGL